MSGENDDTTGLLSTLLKAHKDIKACYYLGAAVLAVDMLLVAMGKDNFASLSLQSAGNTLGIIVLGLIGWMLLQNMIVPIVSSFLSNIASVSWISIHNRIFPNAGPAYENPDDRFYVLSSQLKEDAIHRPDPARIARYEEEVRKGNAALMAAKHLEYASAGITALVVASRFMPGTVVAAMSIWWWLVLLLIALMPWLAWTFGDVLKPDWVADPELAGRIRERRRAQE